MEWIASSLAGIQGKTTAIIGWTAGPIFPFRHLWLPRLEIRSIVLSFSAIVYFLYARRDAPALCLPIATVFHYLPSFLLVFLHRRPLCHSLLPSPHIRYTINHRLVYIRMAKKFRFIERAISKDSIIPSQKIVKSRNLLKLSSSYIWRLNNNIFGISVSNLRTRSE